MFVIHYLISFHSSTEFVRDCYSEFDSESSNKKQAYSFEEL